MTGHHALLKLSVTYSPNFVKKPMVWSLLLSQKSNSNSVQNVLVIHVSILPVKMDTLIAPLALMAAYTFTL